MSELIEILKLTGGGAGTGATLLIAFYFYNLAKSKRNGNGTRTGDITKDKMELIVANHRADCSNEIYVKMDKGFDRIHARLDNMNETMMDMKVKK